MEHIIELNKNVAKMFGYEYHENCIGYDAPEWEGDNYESNDTKLDVVITSRLLIDPVDYSLFIESKEAKYIVCYSAMIEPETEWFNPYKHLRKPNAILFRVLDELAIAGYKYTIEDKNCTISKGDDFWTSYREDTTYDAILYCINDAIINYLHERGE